MFFLNPIGMSDPLVTQISLKAFIIHSVPIMLVSVSQGVVEQDIVGGKVYKFINLVKPRMQKSQGVLTQ